MTKSKRKTTIKDLAKAAQTSAATASLVMNDAWKEHRINPETAKRVQMQARHLGYQPNQRARALRLKRSSLAGLIIPHHRNRFFAGLTEHFEQESHRRGLVPIIGSTQREPELEAKVAASMIAQDVEFLVLAGIDSPSEINRMCRQAGVRCVNVDLPGDEAFSVVTDNEGGARQLTSRLLANLPQEAPVMFLGGRAGEYATDLRIRGFLAAHEEAGRDTRNIQITCCGYSPLAAHDALQQMIRAGKPLPSALLVNSITAFEGFATFWRDHPEGFSGVRVACFDWDPFAFCLPIETIMLRQDVEGLIAHCFDWFDASQSRAGEITMVAPQFATNRIAPGKKE
ncbi:MAG: substrate-binding domain-containing protein [Pseudorhodobacter sp.]